MSQQINLANQNDQNPTRQELLTALGFDSPEQYNEHQRVLGESRELAKKQLATAFTVYSGFVQIDGSRCQVDFETPINASQAEKDSAFVNALSQVASLNYLEIGST